MHFAKTYAAQLKSLPPELRHGVIEYRTLKKLIRQVVDELEAVGLSPEILQSVRLRSSLEDNASSIGVEVAGEGQDLAKLLRLNADERAPVDVLYEFHTRADGTLEPRIRICIASYTDASGPAEELSTPELVPCTLS
jgi:hypothetical protein